jgi:hypothetical protein
MIEGQHGATEHHVFDVFHFTVTFDINSNKKYHDKLAFQQAPPSFTDRYQVLLWWTPSLNLEIVE